jgi:hyperosmotically inducible periplasmic protein
MRKLIATVFFVMIICVTAGCAKHSTANSRSTEPAETKAPVELAITAPTPNAHDDARPNLGTVSEEVHTGDTAFAPTIPGQTGDDRKITSEVRQSIMSDNGLSAHAQNVQVQTDNRVVTLRGPVDSPEEKQNIADRAKAIPGVVRVDDLLVVAPTR